MKKYSGNIRNESFDDIFLDDLPQLSETSIKELEEPFTEKEVTAAIKSLKGGKAPGTDRGTGNKAARRAGQEVKDRDPRKK